MQLASSLRIGPLAALCSLVPGQVVPGGFEVPLAFWTAPSFPQGLVFGQSNGISWGDYDADGWIDIFVAQDARLWRNLGGADWQLAGDFDEPPTQLLPVTSARYGCSFGDYDNDGLPDIAIEPRKVQGDSCFRMLHNLGGGPNFVQVAGENGIISSPCGLPSETIGWADVDADGDLDLFLPVYPAWAPPFGPGNLFWTNFGPNGQGGAWRFDETSAASGLDNPPGTAKPEGAQFCDADQDGDLDLYSNGTLYQNRSLAGAIDFDALGEADSGIGDSTAVDEGAMFFDHDRDGDYDLFVVYSALGVKVWENYGDGTFFETESGVVQSPFVGLGLGMSAEDWDCDGDVDFTTRNVFRRNQVVETGQAGFTVATHQISPEHISMATPAWGDWDKDGDLDCALGDWAGVARFYFNTTYDASTPSHGRRYVRIRPLCDSTSVPRGLENEFGASAEIRVAGETSVRRRKFVASGSGYLNQNEYTLHFGLPADPSPANPAADLRFDVAVDYPSHPGTGAIRVDQHVNPALGGTHLAGLIQREITVFRSGRVRINGCDLVPSPMEAPLSTTTGLGLVLPAVGAPLPAPTRSPGANHFVGIEFDTTRSSGPVRVVEILLDGQLDAAVSSPSGTFNLALWDVPNPAAAPVPVPNAFLAASTSPRNRRSSFTTDIVLAAGRRYRAVARVVTYRASAIVAPVLQGPVVTWGGLSFQDADPSTGSAVAAATVDPTIVYLAIRFRPAMIRVWSDVANGLAGAAGIPRLVGAGSLAAGTSFSLTLTGAAVNSPAGLIFATSIACSPFAGGVIVPEPLFLFPFVTDATGTVSLSAPSPGLSGLRLVFQFWVGDATGPYGLTASNAVWVVT